MQFEYKETIHHRRDVYHIRDFKTYGWLRESKGYMPKLMKRCFCCGKVFRDEDNIYLAFAREGNVLFCESCYKMHVDTINKEPIPKP